MDADTDGAIGHAAGFPYGVAMTAIAYGLTIVNGLMLLLGIAVVAVILFKKDPWKGAGE